MAGDAKPFPLPLRYSAVHFIDLEALRSASWPMEPAHFEELVQQQCAKARDVLRNQ